MSEALLDALGQAHTPASGAPRIVSLVPSLAELLCELGLADRLVGRTGFCIHPRETLRRIPKVGGTKDVKLDAVRALAPTHLVVNIDENRRETVEALAAFVPTVIVTHPCVPADNFGLYRLFGGVFDRMQEAAALTQALEAAMAEAAATAAALPPEQVLYLIWRHPWMAVSPTTYIAAMLAAVGWQTLPAAVEPRYPEIDWRAPWLGEVQRVLLSSEPYRFGAVHLAEVATLSGRPVQAVDGEHCSWYGSRAVGGLRYLARLRRALAGPGLQSGG